jgi:hypothetical protein
MLRLGADHRPSPRHRTFTIKDGKYAPEWTRGSCRRFRDNQARLPLFALACNMANFLRELALFATRRASPCSIARRTPGARSRSGPAMSQTGAGRVASPRLGVGRSGVSIVTQRIVGGRQYSSMGSRTSGWGTCRLGPAPARSPRPTADVQPGGGGEHLDHGRRLCVHGREHSGGCRLHRRRGAGALARGPRSRKHRFIR